MRKKRILIVDDDRDILRMLEIGLKKMGPEYEIITAKNITTAIDEIEKQRFSLILTDYMMPGMTGVDLARAARRMSPDTQVVLMTAYGTHKLRDTTDHLGFDGYINKPFSIDQIRDIIEQTPERSHRQEPEEAELSVESPPKLDTPPLAEAPSIEEQLEKLLVNAGAHGVFLINSEGGPVQVTGQIDNAKVEYVSALVAANFFASAELSNLIDNQKVFGASFFEGDAYNLYVCDVNGKFLLAVVFDARLRPGVVWFYAKQTATTLAPLLE